MGWFKTANPLLFEQFMRVIKNSRKQKKKKNRYFKLLIPCEFFMFFPLADFLGGKLPLTLNAKILHG